MRPIAIGMLAVMLAAGGQRSDEGERLLKAAMNKELVDGDLKGAIEQYRKIARSASRAAAARALVRMGQCYEKLGDAEARKAYERVVREFGDQKEAVEEARKHLAAGGGAPGSGPVLRRIWSASSQAYETGDLSPDGRHAAVWDTETGSLALLELATHQTRRLAQMRPEWPAFSPDGRQIAFAWRTKENDVQLWTVGMDGSGLRAILKDLGQRAFPKAWSPDGKTIAALLFDKTWFGVDLALVSVADGSIRTLKSFKATGGLMPRDLNGVAVRGFSPDGRYLVYSANPAPGAKEFDIFVIPTDGARESVLAPDPAHDWNPLWTPDGSRIVFLSKRTDPPALWSIRVNDGRPQGSPELVKPGVGDVTLLRFLRDGSLAYLQNTPYFDIHEVELDPDTGQAAGPPRLAVNRFQGKNLEPAWSPDGEHVAFWSRRDGRAVIVVYSTKTGQYREFANQPFVRWNNFIRWFPDGKSLLVPNLEKGQTVFRRVDAQSGESREIATFKQFPYPRVELSADGKMMFYSIRDEAGESFRIIRREIDGGAEKEVCRVATSRQHASSMALSPDGRQLAFVNGYPDKSAPPRLMVVPAEGGEPRELLRSAPSPSYYGLELLFQVGLAWTRDGNYIIYPNGEGNLYRIPAQGGRPEALGASKGRGGYDNLSLSPDGRRLLFTKWDHRAEIWVAKNLLP